MTANDYYLLALPAVGYGALAIVGILAARQAIRRHPKKAFAEPTPASMNDADLERALNDLSIAIAKRQKSA